MEPKRETDLDKTPQKLVDRGEGLAVEPPGLTREARSIPHMNGAGAFAERYEIISELGTGGMGVVYKARQRDLGKICAIKMLRSVQITDEAVRRFDREAKAIGKLSHPNLVTAFDFGVSPEGDPYMVMDFVEGKSLANVLAERKTLPVKEAIGIFIQVCTGMAYAHAQGIVHRDLKPSNIMLLRTIDGEPLVKIIDFGIARLLEPDVDDAPSLTKTGEIFGSPTYMSPEQACGQKADARSDIYSLGTVMFEAISGSPPFPGMTAIETILLRLNDPPPRLRDGKGKPMPVVFEQAVATALEKDPDSRWQSMNELGSELKRIRDWLDTPFGATFSKADVKAAAPLEIRPATLAIAGVCMLLAVAVLITWMLFWPASPPPKSSAKPTQVDSLDELMKSDPMLDFSRGARYVITHTKENNIAITPRLKITDAELTAFESTKHYVDIAINDSLITDKGLKSIVHLPLERLVVDGTKIDDLGLRTIAQLSRLSTLSLKQTPITDNGLLELRPLTHLRHLDMDECSHITGLGLKNLVISIPFLQSLSVRADRNISSADFAVLSKLSRIKELDLSETNVSDSAITALLDLKHLDKLKLEHTKVTDKSLPALAKLGLEELSLKNTLVSDRGIATLGTCQRLDQLDLSDCHNVSQLGIAKLKRRLPRCQISD